MPPKLTPLFHPKSNKEANKAIQAAEDVKAELACLNEVLQEFNQKAEEAKATKVKWQQEQQRLAKEQAKKDWCVAAEEKAAREWQEQLAELTWVNWEVSPGFLWNLAF